MRQKQIKEETDMLFPKQKDNVEYNMLRCKYNAMRLKGVSKEEVLKKLGWKEGEELEAEVKKGKLIIEKD